MKNSSLRDCPICQSPESETIHTLNCGNIDRSTLYPTVRLKCCLHCGHFFNDLSPSELKGLNDYYNVEYAPVNLNAADMKGDRPGSIGTMTTERYGQLYNTLSPYIQKHHEILDVGCAMGGFLGYLSQQGFGKLSGVEMTETYAAQARIKNRYRIEQGNAESLPFPNHAFDVVVMEQVLEHLANPARAFQEARRVLRNGGIFCVGIPDASRYADLYFFDFYWLLLREHIQHFDVKHLNVLAVREGFEMLEYRQTAHAVMSERMVMPNLYVIFRLSGSVETTGTTLPYDGSLKRQMEGYINQEKLRQAIKARRIAELSRSRKPVYVWGIGREFLYLYESAGLKSCNIIGLIDMNHLKQSSCSVDGMNITGSGAWREASDDGVLLIAAAAHIDPIRHTAKALGFKGEIFDVTID